MRSKSSFIEYLKKYEKSDKTKNVYEMARSAYREYVKIQGLETAFCGTFEKDVQDEVIKIYKQNGKVCLPEDMARLYKQFVESAKNRKKSIKYKDFMCEYLKETDYEGTFVCISPEKAEKFFDEVEKSASKKVLRETGKK